MKMNKFLLILVLALSIDAFSQGSKEGERKKSQWFFSFALGFHSAKIITESSATQSWDQYFFAGDSKLPIALATEMGLTLNSQLRLSLKVLSITLSHLDRDSASSESHVVPLFTYLIGKSNKFFLNAGLGISLLEGKVDKEVFGGYITKEKNLFGHAFSLGAGTEFEISPSFALRLEYSYEISSLKGTLVEELKGTQLQAYLLGGVWFFDSLI